MGEKSAIDEALDTGSLRRQASRAIPVQIRFPYDTIAAQNTSLQNIGRGYNQAIAYTLQKNYKLDGRITLHNAPPEWQELFDIYGEFQPNQLCMLSCFAVDAMQAEKIDREAFAALVELGWSFKGAFAIANGTRVVRGEPLVALELLRGQGDPYYWLAALLFNIGQIAEVNLNGEPHTVFFSVDTAMFTDMRDDLA